MICRSKSLRLVTLLLLTELTALAFALPRVRGSNEVVSSKNGVAAEPTCEELKAMWRFSKRQSRAAEITNEIPMYRDPFADNVWEPYYATSRSIGGFYGMPRQHLEPRRRLTTFRLSGGGRARFLPIVAPQQGSFEHLKEIITTERARDLQRQRLIEEAAARTAAQAEVRKQLAAEGQRSDVGYDYEPIQELRDAEEQDQVGIGYMENGGNNNKGGGPSANSRLASTSCDSHETQARNSKICP
ncbi:hypothetical protein NQ317_010844 [Molorchus minor]|uniref:Uncharacterized protein n=1 Tax=Molorchus minor TaxID=1323400 RepID=A0ABQ9JZN2_9CUCU|nr:hypothetical protein NQ317_010844 [Molorchus minor]